MKNLEKKILLALTTLLFSSFNLHASDDKTIEQGSFAVNIVGAYGFDMEEPGIRVGLNYLAFERSRFNIDVTNWFLEDRFGVSRTALEFNLNYHFMLINSHNVAIYGIGVIGYHYLKFSFNNEDETDSKTGIGLGMGLERRIGSLSLFAEPKYFFNGYDQFKANIGLRFYLN